MIIKSRSIGKTQLALQGIVMKLYTQALFYIALSIIIAVILLIIVVIGEIHTRLKLRNRNR